MPTLYIVNHGDALASCLEVASPEDSVLLIQDAVEAAAEDHDRTIIALAEDLAQRQIAGLGANVTTTDYPGFVQLVTRHQPIVSWR